MPANEKIEKRTIRSLQEYLEAYPRRVGSDRSERVSPRQGREMAAGFIRELKASLRKAAHKKKRST